MDNVTGEQLDAIESLDEGRFDELSPGLCRALLAEVRKLRQAVEEMADDNSPHDAQALACFFVEAWRD